MKNKKKIGVVLEGGGAKGAYEIGVLKALNQLNIKFDTVVGTSIGALNAVAYAVNEYEAYSQMWSKFKFNLKNEDGEENKDLEKDQNRTFSMDELVNDLDLLENDYINSKGIDPSIIINMLKENIDEDAVRKSSINYGLATYCVSDREPLYLFIKDIPYGQLYEFIFASCNLPIFTPRPINNKYYLDGSFFSRLPVDMLSDKGFDVIITVRLRPESYDFSKYKNDTIIDISPDQFLTSTLQADKDRIKLIMDKGYDDAIKVLSKNIELLI